MVEFDSEYAEFVPNAIQIQIKMAMPFHYANSKYLSTDTSLICEKCGLADKYMNNTPSQFVTASFQSLTS